MYASCLAGAWTQPQGSLQTITSFSYYSTDHYRDNTGRLLPQARFSKFEANPYAEYGLQDGLTIGGDTFLHEVQQRQATRNHNEGLADTELFARWRLYQGGRYALAVQPLVKLPSLYESSALPRSGTLHWDEQLELQGGMNFEALGFHHFTELDGGYRVRGGSSGNQWRGALTLGTTLSPHWTLLPQLSAIWRTEKNTAPAAFTQSGDNDFDLVKGSMSALYTFDNGIGVQVGAFSHLYARNTGTGGGATVAIWKHF